MFLVGLLPLSYSHPRRVNPIFDSDTPYKGEKMLEHMRTPSSGAGGNSIRNIIVFCYMEIVILSHSNMYIKRITFTRRKVAGMEVYSRQYFGFD